MAATRTLLLVPALLATVSLRAATLPEERVDAGWHYYDGGGVQVDGPALEARKNFAGRWSARAHYTVDSISAASVDVVTSATPYREEREEVGAGFQLLAGDALVGVDYTRSEENDYESDTYAVSVAQDFFGGMSTLVMGYAHGDDVVMRVDTDFEDSIDRDSFRLGLTQVLTPTLLATVDYEAVLEEGFLNNPYRSARILGAQVPERYPGTRSSHAVALSARQALAPDAAVHGRYRYFTDTWEIGAHSLELGYARRLTDRWSLEGSYRYYTQDAASFYSDNFQAEFNYMARDKELSSFDSHTLGARLSWTAGGGLPWGLDQARITLSWDHVYFSYDDYTDIRSGELYDFHSDVLQIYFSGWY